MDGVDDELAAASSRARLGIAPRHASWTALETALAIARDGWLGVRLAGRAPARQLGSHPSPSRAPRGAEERFPKARAVAQCIFGIAMSSTPRAKPKSKEVEGASPRASKPKADGDKKPKAKKPKGAAPAERECVSFDSCKFLLTAACTYAAPDHPARRPTPESPPRALAAPARARLLAISKR